MNAGTDANTVSFYVKDVKQQLLSFEFQDENGEMMKPASTITSGHYYSFGFRKAVTPGWQVTILLKTPKALLVKQFKLENIELP